MEPAPTGNNSCQDPGSPHLPTAAPAPTRIHLAQDPGSESEEEQAELAHCSTRCARAAPHNLQGGVFFGKISLSGSAPAQGIAQPHFQHGALQLRDQVVASPPPLLQAAPVALAQGGQTLGGHSELHPDGCCLPFQASFPLSVVSGLPSPHLRFIRAFPATGSLRIGLVSSCSLYCSCIFCSCFCSGSLPEG